MQLLDIIIAPILTCVLLVSFVSCTIKILNVLWFKPKKLEKILREQGLNGNPYKLLVGDLRDLIAVSSQERTRSIQLHDDLPSHILPYFHQTLANYGKNSFLWFGPRPTLCITDPELLKEILARSDLFHKARPDPVGETIVGGLFYLEDGKWAKRRKILNPSFHTEKLKNMVPSISLCCSNMIEEWDALVSRNDDNSLEFDIWPYIENLSGDVISRTAFSSSYEAGKRVFDLQNEQLKLAVELMTISFIPGWSYVPTKANRRLKVIDHQIRSILRAIIDSRKKKMDQSGEKIEGDLLNTLLECNARETKGMMSIEEVIDECKLFYIAGSETTSSLICWAMILLSINQEWQSRARDEVMRVFGGNQLPTPDGLNRLRILNMILLEVLRMYPPVPVSIRSPSKTVKLGNITLPKGVGLMLLIGLLHHDPTIWGEDVNEFKPERFIEGSSCAVKNPFSYIPFSGGPRICIGQNLAMIEAKVVMSMILRRFSFELGSSYVHAPFPILTLRPQRGAALLLHKL